MGFLKQFNLPKVKKASKKNKNWKFLCNYKNYISNKKLNINLYYKFSSRIPSNYNWYYLNKNKEFIPSFTKKIFKQNFNRELEDIFDMDYFEPIASGSIGQVYVTKFKDSEKKVAVKVKHPLVKGLAKRLKGQIDYPEKPAKKGYPNDPPPKMVDGWHPKLGQKYKYDKLDPQSAEAMPDTGDPEIDANIEKATDKKAKTRKSKVLAGKTEQFSNWRDDLTDA
mgnify:CR=1 FL=1